MVRLRIWSLGAAGLVLLTGGLVAGLGEARTHPALEAARRENRELRARHEVLLEQALDLVRQVAEGAERRGQWARLAGVPDRAGSGQSPNPPAPAAGDEALLDWLSEQSLVLRTFAQVQASEPLKTL